MFCSPGLCPFPAVSQRCHTVTVSSVPKSTNCARLVNENVRIFSFNLVKTAQLHRFLLGKAAELLYFCLEKRQNCFILAWKNGKTFFDVSKCIKILRVYVKTKDR